MIAIGNSDVKCAATDVFFPALTYNVCIIEVIYALIKCATYYADIMCNIYSNMMHGVLKQAQHCGFIVLETLGSLILV